MALAIATVTINLADLAGVPFKVLPDPRISVRATTNAEAVVDTEGDKIRLGSGTATLNPDGTGTLAVWAPGTGSNPASWQTTIHVAYPDPTVRGGRGNKSFGPFTITADANLADLVAEMPVLPEYASDILDRLDVLEAGGGSGGSGSTSLIVVSGGTVDLPNEEANGYLVGYKVTATTTIEGVPFPVGRYIFERDSAATYGWTYRTLVNGTDLAPPTGDDTPVMPTAPTFTDESGTSSDTYTIPAQTGVIYSANGVVKGAGVHPGIGTVTITTVAEAGYILVGTTEWTHVYDTSGPVLLPTTTFSDTFTKTDGTLIAGSIATSGQTWDGHPSVNAITGGKLVPASTSAASFVDHGTLPSSWALEANVVTGTTDLRIYVRNPITAYGDMANNGLGIYLLWQSGVPRLILRGDEMGANFTETYNLNSSGSKFVVVPSGTNTTPHLIRLQVAGTTATWYVDGTRVMEGTLNSTWLAGLTGTKLAISGEAGATIDNLKVLTP